MPRDFGDFLIPPPPAEGDVTQDLIRRARASPAGEHWVRVVNGTVQQLGYVIEGWRILHVDLKRQTLEVTEEWGGVITARRTTPLRGF